MSGDANSEMLSDSMPQDSLGYISEVRDAELYWRTRVDHSPLHHGAHHNFQSLVLQTFNSGRSWLGAAALDASAPDSSSMQHAQRNLQRAANHAVQLRDQSDAYRLMHRTGTSEHADEDPTLTQRYLVARAAGALLAGRIVDLASVTLEHDRQAEMTLRANAGIHYDRAFSGDFLPPILALDARTAAVRNAIASGDMQRAAKLRRAIIPTVARVAFQQTYELGSAWDLLRRRTFFKNSDVALAQESIRQHP